jgi:hypothetical protein
MKRIFCWKIIIHHFGGCRLVLAYPIFAYVLLIPFSPTLFAYSFSPNSIFAYSILTGSKRLLLFLPTYNQYNNKVSEESILLWFILVLYFTPRPAEGDSGTTKR